MLVARGRTTSLQRELVRTSRPGRGRYEEEKRNGIRGVMLARLPSSRTRPTTREGIRRGLGQLGSQGESGTKSITPEEPGR